MRGSIKPIKVTCASCNGKGKIEAVLGSQLRSLREGARLSLRELGSRVGFSAAYLSDVELGRRNVTSKLVRLYEREC